MAKPVVGQLFSLLEQYEVTHVVCSPGSRNAALLLEADARKNLKKIVVVDERSAAFIALGIAMVSRAPVALVCTSGSALLNYSPALSEAYYQGIPLIAISADRPLEWIDQDDSQTIRQPFALSNFVKGNYDLDGDRDNAEYVWYANRVINEGLDKALNIKEGPVHFNIHLDGAVNDQDLSDDRSRKINVWRPSQQLDKDSLREFISVGASGKLMFVAGFMPPDNKLQKAMLRLSSLPNVCIMAETVSNLHLKPSAYMIDTVLFKLSEEEERELAPDIVISLGGALISRKLKEFLRRNPPKYHWSLNSSDNIIDCFKALTDKLECNPASFLQTFGKRIMRMHATMDPELIPRYGEKWDAIRDECSRDISSRPWSDLKALKIVFGSLPQTTNLFLSNGTVVRYAQIIPHPMVHAVYANRGVSGIEGSTSTALGGSIAYAGFTCLITGDMSFSYDVGALSSQLLSSRLRIIVLDNGGGDIFRFIPATKNLSIREKYLCADREPPIEELAEAYDLKYFYADSEKSLKKAVNLFFENYENGAILHIDTSQCRDNADILRKFLTEK